MKWKDIDECATSGRRLPGSRSGHPSDPLADSGSADRSFTVTHVTDIANDIASSVAARLGARWSTSIDELLDDPQVDVVAICSPHQFHAAQVIAACRAGKKAVLCEKPFAMSGEEASEIAAVSIETGVPIMVGAM